MTRSTLVAGGSAAQRLASIASRLVASHTTVVIAEGAQNGASLPAAVPLADTTATRAALRMAVIAPGCPHCDNGLVMRVTLDRILRHPPADLFIWLIRRTCPICNVFSPTRPMPAGSCWRRRFRRARRQFPAPPSYSAAVADNKEQTGRMPCHLPLIFPA